MALVIEGRGGNDPLYEQAVELVRTHKIADLRLLQQNFPIGYARSAMMLEAMVGSVIESAGGRYRVLDAHETEQV